MRRKYENISVFITVFSWRSVGGTWTAVVIVGYINDTRDTRQQLFIASHPNHQRHGRRAPPPRRPYSNAAVSYRFWLGRGG